MRVIKRIVLFVILFFILISCRERKMEFIESKTIKGLVLVKNLPLSPCETGKMIVAYIKDQKKKDFMEFYEYTSSTKKFVDNKRIGGYSREYIHHYQEENGICVFYCAKCKKNTLEQVGVIRYYEKYGNFYEPDTIIGKCKWFRFYKICNYLIFGFLNEKVPKA